MGEIVRLLLVLSFSICIFLQKSIILYPENRRLEDIKLVEEEDAELASPHEHAKNTFKCETILTENYLETSRMTLYNQSCKKGSHGIRQQRKKSDQIWRK